MRPPHRPSFAWFLINRQIAEFCLFLAVLVWWRHAANIKRLLKGEESKIQLSSSKHPVRNPTDL